MNSSYVCELYWLNKYHYTKKLSPVVLLGYIMQSNKGILNEVDLNSWHQLKMIIVTDNLHKLTSNTKVFTSTCTDEVGGIGIFCEFFYIVYRKSECI